MLVSLASGTLGQKIHLKLLPYSFSFTYLFYCRNIPCEIFQSISFKFNNAKAWHNAYSDICFFYTPEESAHED
jgi:hypothetical protein